MIGTLITKWWAGRKNWNDSFFIALAVNFLLFIIILIISFLFLIISFLFADFLIGSLIGFIIDCILGGFIVSKLYKLEFKESLSFTIWLLIVEIILSYAFLGIFISLSYFY